MNALPSLAAGVPLPGARSTHATRRAALAELAAAGWPNRKREAWRYTDLEPLASAALDLVAPPAAGDRVGAAARALDDIVGVEHDRALVLLDGQRVLGLGAAGLAELEVVDPESRWSAFADAFAGAPAAARYPLAALNTAFTQHGLWLRVPAGTIIERPVHLVILSSGRPGLAAQPRIVVDVEPGARITLIQHFVDAAGTRGWTNAVTQLRQARGSSVELYRAQRHDTSCTHTSLLTARMAADAQLNAFYLELGGGLVRNDVEISLAEPGARVELNGVFLAGSGQHIDTHTIIDHAARETHSVERFRGIIGEHGRGVFNGKVIVRPNSQRIEATQSSDNLLLGEHAEIDTKPELEIYANDVKCSHGATVGELDADQLFYLRSRGLGDAESRELLTTAFATVVLDRIRTTPERNRALDLVAERLRTLGRG